MAFFDPFRPSRLLDQSFALEITPEDIIVPSYNFFNSNYYRPWKATAQNGAQEFGSSICNEKDNFKICLDVQQFRPNEIIVKTTKTEIIIEGKHEERADEHGFISRQFRRKYKLPEFCDSDTVTSNLTKDGVLIISATKKYLKDENGERVIPIKMCETCPTANITKVKSECNNNIQQKDMKNDIIESKNSLQKEITKSIMEDKMINTSEQIESLKDHCSSLNRGVGSLRIKGNSEKMSESRIESEETMQMLSSGKLDKSNLGSRSEVSGFSSMSCETVQSKEAAYSSSISFGMKSSNENTSERINEIIATELKQAAEM